MAQRYKARHTKKNPRLGVAIMTVLALACGLLGWGSQQAGASVSYGNRALDWAQAHALNASYAWGGTGPSYDCSGLVLEAYGHADGIWLPHYTGAMVHDGRLSRTWSPQRGDLAFWGPVNAPWHVEFVTVWHQVTFGAETYGWAGRVTWHSYRYWIAPSAFYRVIR
jgi:hypothetical protein